MGWLGLLACLSGLACGGAPGGDDATTVAREDSARACAPGVASRVARVNPPGSHAYARVEHLTDVAGTLFFSTDSATTAPVLWRSDGTSQGTVPLRTFSGGINAFLGDFAAVGRGLFFSHEIPGVGLDLWRSDGTTRGTRRVKVLSTSEGVAMGMALEVHGRLLFVLNVMMGPSELWTSDGTEAGTVKLAELGGVLGLAYSRTLVVADAWLFFRQDARGTALWRSDATAEGTRLVARLDQGETWVEQVLQVDGRSGLFVLRDAANDEVWRTDGTAAGTVRLDTFGTPVRLLGTLGDQVYLASSTQEATLRLVRLPLAGGARTYLSTLPNPGPDLSASVERSTASEGRLYFSVAYGGSNPIPSDARLWVTDGTLRGTRSLFGPLLRNEERGSPVFATGGGPVLFVDGEDGDLWFTRGTAATTGKVVALRPDTPVFPEEEFTRVGDRVYFSARDESGLRQLWSVPTAFSCPPGPTGQAW